MHTSSPATHNATIDDHLYEHCTTTAYSFETKLSTHETLIATYVTRFGKTLYHT